MTTNIGDVLYFPDFEFPDGGHANKLLAIISDCSKEDIVLVILTSKGKYARSQGCQPAAKKFFIKSGKYGLDKDTWADLGRNAFTYKTKAVEAVIAAGRAIVALTLPFRIPDARPMPAFGDQAKMARNRLEHFFFKNALTAAHADGRRETASAICLRVKRRNGRFQIRKI